MGMFRIIFFFVVIYLKCFNGIEADMFPNCEVSPRISTEVNVVDSYVSDLGEGPFWDAATSSLLYVDATKRTFHRLNPESKELSSVTLSEPGIVSIIIPYESEKETFLVSHGHQLLKLQWNTKQTEVLASLPISQHSIPYERYNDAKCDPLGRLFIGTVLHSSFGSSSPIPHGGSLYRLDGSTLVKVATGFTLTNGMAWSNLPNVKKFYLNDSEGRKVYSFDFNFQYGTLENKTIFIDCNEHQDFVRDEYPDGMAMDSSGFLWIALWNGGRIVRINPFTGRVVDEVIFPRARIPSSLAFGPYNGKDGFYVTTASTGIESCDLKDDGKIHHVSFNSGNIFKFNS